MLLHLTTPSAWRSTLDSGAVLPAGENFVHLSTPEQVSLPATRLFHGRRDLLLLVLDPGRLPEVRWEPGVPTDPASMRFPHAYGPVPARAVLAAVAYRPRPDGGFDAPELPALDPGARLAAWADSLPRRVATGEVAVPGGVAVRQDEVPWSHALNQLLVDGATPTAEIVAAADAVLGDRDHRCVTLRGADPGRAARALGRAGWGVRHEVGMARALDGSVPERADGPVADRVDLAEVRDLWARARRPELPADHPLRRGLPDRFAVDDRGCAVTGLAVREAGRVVAGAALLLDGATAVVEAVETDTAHRRRGHATALLARAVQVASAAGCDLLGLHAMAADWPRRWYARRGFAVVGERWSASRG